MVDDKDYVNSERRPGSASLVKCQRPVYCPGPRMLPAILPALVFSLFASGCNILQPPADAEPEAPTIQAYDRIGDWDTPFGRLGLVPLIPPSEDVRVGDMFAYPFNPDIAIPAESRARSGGLAINARWASLSLLEELEAEYLMRPAWPATPDAYLQIDPDPENRDWAEPSSADGRSIFAADSVPQRLRNFGIPEFSTATMSEGDINALVPTEAINLVLGSAWNDDKAISIRLNSAETYSLGLQKIIDIAFDDSGSGAVLKSPYRENLALIANPSSDSVWIRLLSDVVYARSMDITIHSRSAFDEDGEVNASEFVAEVEETVVSVEKEDEATDAESDRSSEGEEAVQTVVTETVSAVVLDHVLDPAYAAFVRANAINELLIEADADDLPGGFLRFISVTDDSVTLRRIWQRGLAIGMRGLTLELDKNSGAVLRSGNMGNLQP